MGSVWPLRRTMPPVLSTVSLPALIRASATGISRGRDARDELSREVSTLFQGTSIILTDSGTSALVLALRMVATRTGVVGIPAYGCPDLASAASRAGVGLRLYDLDPATLSPDSSSVEDVLGRGVDAIVVVHLFGFPADVTMVAEKAGETGADVIEDAAQGAGGFLSGRRLGCLSGLSVLSFGRGKGITGGGGGALIIRDPGLAEKAEGLRPRETSRIGWAGLSAALAQRVLARPGLYGIPASIPALKLGEMVYHDAGEPRDMGRGNAALAADALGRMDEEAEARTRIAGRLEHLAASGAGKSGICTPIPGGKPGYLRFPAVLPEHAPDARLGILRAYPVTLGELPETTKLLLEGEESGPGATRLSRGLLTLPTHQRIREAYLARVAQWLEGV